MSRRSSRRESQEQLSGSKRRHSQNGIAPDAKRARPHELRPDETLDDTRPGEAEVLISQSPTFLQTISQWVIEVNQDQLTFIRNEENFDTLETICSEEDLRGQEIVTVLQSFSSAFASAFVEVSTGHTLALVLKWARMFLQLRRLQTPCLDPSYVRTTLDTVRRYIQATYADPIALYRQQPPGKSRTPMIIDQLEDSGWNELRLFMESVIDLVKSKSVSRWEMFHLPSLLGCLCTLSEEDIKTNASFHIQLLGPLSRDGYHQLLLSGVMRLDDLMESLIEKVVLIDLPPTVRLPADKMGPFYGGSNILVTTPDGSKLHRATALMIELAQVNPEEDFVETSTHEISKDLSQAIKTYRVLPSWPLKKSVTSDTAEEWNLRQPKRKWARIQAVSKVISTQSFTFLLQIWTGSKAAFLTNEAQNAVRRRAGLLRTLIEDLGSILSSPFYPTAHVLFFAFIDSLARLSFHDSFKTPAIFHQCYMELARDAYTLLADLSGQVQSAQTLRRLESMDKCFCGFEFDNHTAECIHCGTRAHTYCVSSSTSTWQCDSCTLDEKAITGGYKLLDQFASRFDSKTDTCIRRKGQGDTDPGYTARTFPIEAVSEVWKLMVAIGASVYAQYKDIDLIWCFFSSLVIKPTSVTDDDGDTIESPDDGVKDEPASSGSSGGISEDGLVSFAECQRDLLRFSLLCLSKETIKLSPVDLQTFALTKLWWIALDSMSERISSKLDSNRRMLKHVLTGKFFATLSSSSPHNQNVKLADTLITSVTKMICSVPGSPAAEILESDLQMLYEEFLRSGRTGPTIRRSLLSSLRTILHRCCDSIWSSGKVQSDSSLLARSDELGLETSFFPFIRGSEEYSAATNVRNFLTLSGNVGRQERRRQMSPKTLTSNYRHLVNFVRWIAPITLCREIQASSQSVRNEAWKVIADAIYVCPLDQAARPLLEKLLLALPQEDVLSVRRELLSTLHCLFFSSEACQYICHLRNLDFQALPQSEPSIEPSESEGPLPSSNESISSDEQRIDPQQWPPVHQYSHLLVCMFVVARRQSVVILDDEGAEISLLSAVADTPLKQRQQQSITPMRPRAASNKGRIFEELSSILISFFTYCRQIPQANVSKHYQKFVLEVIEGLGSVCPQAVLQIVPFAAPYLSSVPSSTSGVHLTAQICQLLASILRRDPKILGDADTVRRGPQKNLVRLTRVRGMLSRAAILLLGELLTLITGDFGLIVPEIISKDISILAKGIHGNVEAVNQLKQKPKFKQFEIILSSPIFALRNIETLKHSLLRIGTVVEAVDLVSVIESDQTQEGSERSYETRTPSRLGTSRGCMVNTFIPMTQVSQWFTINQNMSLLPLPSSGTHFILTLYDLLCDANLLLAELKGLWNLLKKDVNEEVTQKYEDILTLLDEEFSPATINCITSIVSRYREFIGSSRLRSILELSLNSACAEQQLSALNLMLKSLQVPRDENIDASTSPGVFVTPLNKQVSSGSTPLPAHHTQSRARLTQPLCRHLPVVANYLRDAPCETPLSFVGSGTLSKTPVRSHQAQCRMVALDLFAEVIAQGLISASDLFEFVGCCFIAGDKSVEAKTRQLISKILTSTKDPAVVLRRKVPLVILSAFAMFSNRLHHSFEIESSGQPSDSCGLQVNSCGLKAVNYVDCFKPITVWYQDYLTTKVSTRMAFTEGVVAALEKLSNYAEVVECLRRSFPDTAGYSLPDITRDGRSSNCDQSERVLFFVAAYAGFCAALLMAIPWRHLGELREVLIACQKLIEPIKVKLSVDPDAEMTDHSQQEVSGEDDMPIMYDDDLEESRTIFKLTSGAFVALAALHLKHQLWLAYKVDKDSKEVMKKRVTNKEGETRPFLFDRQIVDSPSGSNVVSVFDLNYPMKDYLDDAVKLLETARRELRQIRTAAKSDVHQAAGAIDLVLRKTKLPELDDLDISFENLPE